MLKYSTKSFFLFLLVTLKVSNAIIISSNSSSATSEGNVTSSTIVPINDDRPPNKESGNSNTTFYYEPNTFLINHELQKDVQLNSEEKNRQQFKPAAVAQTSGRSGRMLDLDALVGDMTASRVNKERSMSGNRQSRFLTGSNLDIGPGKKLHIQGYIPIVGVKDATDDEKDSIGESSSEQDLATATKQQQRYQNQQMTPDLPYAQSSIGHASFGVQRFLNSDQAQAQSVNDPQVDAKFSGASVVDSLKRPLKRLTGYEQQQQQQQASGATTQNCLCVPFYMCKNGYISESSLGKSQIQQMIQQQQQQQQQQQLTPKQMDQQADLKTAQLLSSHQQQRPSADYSGQQAQYADSLVPVDERSNEREIITMAPLTSSELNQQVNHSEVTVGTELSLQQLQSAAEESLGNSTDYSQDILGRMLGIKASKTPNPQSSTSSAGACGLLRSCCNIPLHLFPSAQDIANERFMSQYGTGAGRYQQPQQQQQQTLVQSNKQSMYPTDLVSSQQQQIVAMQRYQQQQSALANQKLPYGFPSSSHISSQRMQQPVMQPLNSPFSALESTALAHRSNQFNQSPSNRYQVQASNQVPQYTRAAQQMQQLQSFQQPQQSSLYQQAKAIPSALSSVPLGQQVNAQTLRGSQSILGNRKILEGRCGIRQSAGITGRVQALQYPDSSADFGEYPAQAAILKRMTGSDSLFVCGGTLISQYWVATAAHCIKKHAQGDLKIRLGEWDVHRDDEFYPFVEKDVRDLIVHPDFVSGNLVNDIALLRLDTPVDPSLPHVNPACLPGVDESFARQRCWVTGWGKDSFGQKGSFQSVLREVELPVVGHSECESALRQTRLGSHYRLHSGFICAGGEGGRDACEGDGGSGLYCVQDGVIKVAGLVSWGIGCGQAGVPGVYVSLAHYRPWIENIISIDEDIYSPYSNMVGSNLINERSNANSNATTEPSETTSAPTTTTISIPAPAA